MDKSEYHRGINLQSRNNKMIGMRDKDYEYELPYPMKHMLEIQKWVELFRPEPLYNKVKDQLVKTRTDKSIENKVVACETCTEIKECGFNHDEFFTRDEYYRILTSSRACSLDCAIEYVFLGDYAPTVSQFKDKPYEYKTLGSVNHI